MCWAANKGCFGRWPCRLRSCCLQAAISATAIFLGCRCGWSPPWSKHFRPGLPQQARSIPRSSSIEELLKLAEPRPSEGPAHSLARIDGGCGLADRELETGYRLDVVAVFVEHIN